MQSYHLNVFDLQLSFRTKAGPERVEQARAYVENLYEQMKAHGGSLGKERLLAILLIGLADDLLQLQERSSLRDSKVDQLLQNLKENAPEGGSAAGGEA